MILNYITNSKTKCKVVAPNGTDSVSLYAISVNQSTDNTIKKINYTAREDSDVTDGWIYYIEPLSSWSTGKWNYQVIASSNEDGESVVDSGTFNISLSLKDAAALNTNIIPYDGRTQAQKDLDDCELAIRELVSGRASSYTISGRQFNKLQLHELRVLQSHLIKQVNAELISLGFKPKTYGNPRIQNYNFIR